MPMSRDEFARFISPAQLQFVLAVQDQGLADYDDDRNYGPGARIAHDKRVRAQNRNAHIVHRAKMMAWEHPELGIRHELKRNRQLFYIHERARLSFKKIDENLRHSNYPTQQALNFDAQKWPGEADTSDSERSLWADVAAPPLATNLVGGYLLNETETGHSIYIVCPDGDESAWSWPLTRADIIELMAAENPAATAAAEKIQKRPLPMRAKRAKKGQEEAH
jgi:hypothetical protein